MNLNRVRTSLTGAMVAAAMSVGFLTVSAGAAHALTSCGGDVSVYGVLSDGRLTYTAIAPATGDRVRTLIGPALGFTPKAMATLNFNTILVTSTTGDLYRVDIQTNVSALTLAGVTKIWDGGWTFDKLTYDGHGHLYGTVDGQLHQYVVSEDKPSGPAHIGQHVVIGTGFVLKTLAAAGDDQLVASTADGRLLSYRINGADDWDRGVLAASGWSAVDSLTSPGGGLYYGRTNGGMYWYTDADPFDNDGGDLTYHSGDPVDTSGWTQTILSASGGNCTYTPDAPPTSTLGGSIGRSEILTRGKDWYVRDVPYDQSSYAWDLTRSKQYREDCSGFVSMAWHLADSYSTSTLYQVSSTISKSSLRPGDALNYAGVHTVLFIGWKDQVAGTFYYYSESNASVDMEYGTANVNSGNIAGWPATSYAAIRYDKVV
jgi:hypothetical protein